MVSNSLSPPVGASALYKTIHATALAFIDAQAKDESQPDRMDFSRIRALCAPNFRHSWGHKYLVSTKPFLQGTPDVDGFINHLSTMLPRLEGFDAGVTDVVVDEVKIMAILRISFRMRPKDVEEVVENDLLWMLGMNRDGKLVEKSVEFIDGVAAGRLAELMMGKKE